MGHKTDENTGLRVFVGSSHALQGVSPNGRELSRLISAAVVSQRFCDLLLSDPETALRIGYNGTGSFQLAPEDWELVVSIRATSLADFAAQLTGNGHSQTSLLASRK